MARIEHNDTYVLLRVLQIMCAVIVTGQAVCILLPITRENLKFNSSFEMLLIFTIILGAGSILKPCFWLSFQKLSDRFTKLVWVELVVDFQVGAAWFLVFVIQMQASSSQADSYDRTENLTDPSVRKAVVLKATIERLWSICQIFIIISGILWQTSGIMNSRQIWKDRKRNSSGNQRGLLDGCEFTSRSLRSKPSTLSTARTSPINHNIVLADFDSSAIHLQSVSPSFDVEAGRSPTDCTMRGQAL